MNDTELLFFVWGFFSGLIVAAIVMLIALTKGVN